MNEISESMFKPTKKEICSYDEALEILAFGWYPVDDENLLDHIRRRYPNFYYGYDYNNIKESCKLKGDYIGYSKHTGKYYINYDRGYHRIETEEELNYYRKLQKAMAKLNFLIRNKEISISGYAIHRPYPWEDVFWGKDRLDSLEVFKSFKYGHYDYDYDTTGKEYSRLTNVITSDVEETEYDIYFEFKTDEIMRYYKPLQEDVIKGETKFANHYSTPYLDIINEMIAEGRISKENQRTTKELKYEIIEKGKQHKVKITETLAGKIATVMRMPESQIGGNKKRKQR